MKKQILSLIFALCFQLTLFPAYALDTASETATDAPPEHTLLTGTPDSSADMPELKNANVPDSDADMTEPDDAVLQAANISWPVEGGRLLFDGLTGTITGYTGTLTDLEIPSEIYGVAVTTIGDGAFQACSTLVSVTIPDSVTHIGGSVFYGCSGLVSVIIPDSVTHIDGSAFSYCSGLKTITLPKNITYISSHLFSDCPALTNIEIPENVTYIGHYAFANCTKLQNIDFPSSVTEIDFGAFYNCISLTSVAIPDRVTSIDVVGYYGTHNGVFESCSSLATLTIPESVTNIGQSAFAGCPVTDIYYYGSLAQWLRINIEGGNDSLVTAELHFLTPSYTITFHPNGGTVSPTTKILSSTDTVYGSLPVPTRDGYDFQGWFTSTYDGTQIAADTEFTDRHSQTLYAMWTETGKNYTVTFEGNGGSVTPSSMTVDVGGVYGELPEPVRKGCDFLGWFTEPSGGEQITAETEVALTADQTLYAHWEATNIPEISQNGQSITDAEQISTETGADLSGSLIVADAENPDEFYTASAFCAVYDAEDHMVHLQVWDVDVSDPRNISFMGNIHIPEGISVSRIKIMILSDDLAPLQAPGEL